MPELNRDLIIKALECCQTEYHRNCNECPYERHKKCSISVITCESILREDLLTLIKQLTEENERLKEKADRHLYNLKAVLEERAEANTDVAREIFEEIEKQIAYEDNIFEKCASRLVSSDYCNGRSETIGFVLNFLIDLKKKYMGE